MSLTEAAFGSRASAQGVWMRSRPPVALGSMLTSVYFVVFTRQWWSSRLCKPLASLWRLTKWYSTTRLETRTKESNMSASVWVVNPNAEWKWRGRFRTCPLVGIEALRCDEALPTDLLPSVVVGLSWSSPVRTRKMVNYAWAGWSQRKLWWRSVAVLTCKSIVGLGYRGERLIEPSSSWFLPKFPSG